jgi:sensor histidine kinase YesM
MRVLVITAAAVLLIIFLLGLMSLRFLVKPLTIIEKIAANVKKDDFDALKSIDDNENCVEINDIFAAIANLVGEIRGLKIEVYEERIVRMDMQLLYLKSQAAPHFLINCLSTISALAVSENSDKSILLEMVKTLSKHLRYTLSPANTVTLADELKYTENYLKMCELRFPGCLCYEITAEEPVKSALVFPLIILMFTENSIKHNLIMGESFKIIIRADTQNSEFIHITHIDSGTGFDEDFFACLDSSNASLPDGVCTDSEGRQLGIKNIRIRLELMYGKGAQMRFSNEPGLGARIDIIIPLKDASQDSCTTVYPYADERSHRF